MDATATSDRTTAKRKHYIHFIEGTHAFIGIDKSIVDKLHLTENDSFVQEVTTDGIFLRRETKQKV